MRKLLHFGFITLILFLFSNNLFGQADIYVSEVLSPVNACSHTDTEMVSVVIKIANSDSVPVNDTIPLVYIINGITSVYDTIFLSNTLYSTDSIIFDFDTLADLSATGTYSFDFICNYSYDTVQSNDTLILTVATFGTPTTVVTNDTTICSGNDITLSVGGGSAINYTWNTGDSISIITVTPTDTTLYTVTTTDSNSCSTTDSINVYVNPNPNIMFNVADTSTACLGTNYTYTASGGDMYYWNTTADTTPSISVLPTDTMFYSVVVSQNGCASTDSILVNTIAPTYTLIPDTFTCNGDSITLYASDGQYYFWSTSDSTETISILPTISAEYYVTITDEYGCSFNDSVLVDVHTYPTINTTFTDSTICSGHSISVTASGADSYTWDNGAVFDSTNSETAQLSPMTTTIFNVYGTTLGCTNSTTVQVNVNQSPDLNLEDVYNITEDNILVIGVTGGYSSYSWSNGETDETIVINGFTLGTGTYTYWVNATASNGCISFDTTTINIADGVGFGTNINVSKIKIFPNPSHGILYLETFSDNLTYNIINAKGQSILSNELKEPKATIDLFAFEKGIYFIQLIQNGNIVATRKIILE